MSEVFFVVDEESEATHCKTLDEAIDVASELARGGLEAVVCKVIRKFVPMAQEVDIEETDA